MATYLINAIASIPSNPQDDDVIRFGTPITTGIPTTIKKANGTTTEDAIGVGYEYRYFASQSAWLKIGGDAIVTTPLRDTPVLATGEFAGALLGAVHNDKASGRLRKLGLGILQQALQAVNPIKVSIQKDTVWTGNPPGNIWVNKDLNIKSGTTRYNFDDYIFMQVIYNFNYSELIPISDFKMTNQTNYLVVSPSKTDTAGAHVAYNNNTSFYTRRRGNYAAHINRIDAYKLVVSLETP